MLDELCRREPSTEFSHNRIVPSLRNVANVGVSDLRRDTIQTHIPLCRALRLHGHNWTFAEASAMDEK
jgi:hypothetical protein